MSEFELHSARGLKEIPGLLLDYVRDPVGLMRRPNVLSFPAALTLLIGTAAASGAVGAWVDRSWINLIAGVVVLPIAALTLSSVYTLFLYYYFAVTARTYLEMRRLYTIAVLATFPYFLIHALSGFLAPLDLLGFALTCLLVIVGLTEQFGLPKAGVIKLQAALFGIFCVVWGAVQVGLN